jgi:hypothetical protein
MDDRTDKHSANGLRTNAQRTTTNIPVSGIEELLLFWYLPSSSFCHRRVRKTDLKIILPSLSSWPNLTTTKRRRDRRKLFHGGDIISALMPPSGNKSLHIVMSMKMLTALEY